MGALLIAFSLLATAAIAPPAKAVPKVPEGFLGIVPQEGISRLDTKRMHRGKVKSLRAPVPWSTVQAVNAKQFDWNGLDSTIKVAAREGVRVMPTLYASPSWLTKRSTNLPVDSRHQLKKWRKFVKAAVERYGSHGDFWDTAPKSLPYTPVREWQIWNEVNFHYFATPVDPAEYGKLLDSSAKVIHKNDAKAEVVVSGLFARPKGSERQAVEADRFIKLVAKHSLNRSVDSIALHPYAADTATLKEIMRDFRHAAVKAGYKKKALQITEIGWGSGPATNSFLKGSKGAQADQLKSAFRYLVTDRHKLKLKNVYWFAWQDTDPNGVNCSFCYTIGLFAYRKKNKLVAKPAWNQFVRFTRGKP
ncbi:MAG: beta-galactosidase [Thermoleophilia bacterium]|nr:beta-galactosidase [Thermoleophilia bacterium]